MSLLYLVVGTGWILYSDRWIGGFGLDPQTLTLWQTAKGLIYICTTTGLLYLLLRRHEIDAILQRRKSYSQALIENASDIIVILSAEGIFRYCSPSAERILGYSPSQVLGQRIPDFTHPEDLPQVFEVLTAALQAPGVSQPLVEYRVRHRDGSWLMFEAITTNLLHLSAIQGVVVNCRDISDRKQAEQSLRTSEQQFRKAILNAPYPIIIHAEDGQVLQISQAWTEITGYTLTDIPTMADWTEKGYGHRKDLVKADIDRLYSLDSRVEEGEYTLTTAWGETRIWDFSSAPLGVDGAGKRLVISMAKDITERKILEQTLEQRVQERTAQLEAANRELDAFSYSVSHDLRAPLRHISGFVNVLGQALDQRAWGGDAQIAHYLEVIRSSSDRMGLLIDGLLNLSRVGRKPLALTTVELRSLVDRAIALVKSQVSEAAWSALTFDICALPSVTGDAVLLQQVFTNLIDNAVKFTRHQLHPTITIGAEPDGTLFIRDNGVGFSMAYTDQLFGAFQRLHSKSEFEGTGIGLAIVQRIVHRHGGRIWAESTPNQGTTFYFCLDCLPGEKNCSSV